MYLLVADPGVSDAVAGNVGVLPQGENEVGGLLVSDAALFAAGEVDTIGLAVRAGCDWIYGNRVGSVGGLDIEADEMVRRGSLVDVLRQDVGSRRALVVVDSGLVSWRCGHDGGREEESSNGGEEVHG